MDRMVSHTFETRECVGVPSRMVGRATCQFWAVLVWMADRRQCSR